MHAGYIQVVQCSTGGQIYCDAVIYHSPEKNWCSARNSASEPLTETVGLGVLAKDLVLGLFPTKRHFCTKLIVITVNLLMFARDLFGEFRNHPL